MYKILNTFKFVTTLTTFLKLCLQIFKTIHAELLVGQLFHVNVVLNFGKIFNKSVSLKLRKCYLK